MTAQKAMPIHGNQPISINELGKGPLLLIVDLLKGFTDEGALASPRIQRIGASIGHLAKVFNERGWPIIALNDAHQTNSTEFTTYPPHCVAGTQEAELITELSDLPITIIPKNSTNALIIPGVAESLLELSRGHEPVFIVVGCCTDICILQTALTLKAKCDEVNRSSRIIVPSSMVDTFDGPDHDADQVSAWALSNMKLNGIEVVGEIEYL